MFPLTLPVFCALSGRFLCALLLNRTQSRLAFLFIKVRRKKYVCKHAYSPGRKKLGRWNAHTRSLVQLWCGVGLELIVGLSALDPLSGQEKWRRLAGSRFEFIAFYVYVVPKWPIEYCRLKVAFYLASQNQMIINGYKKNICNGFINFVRACKFLEWTFINLYPCLLLWVFAGQQWVPGLKRLLEHILKDERVHNTVNMKKNRKRS